MNQAPEIDGDPLLSRLATQIEDLVLRHDALRLVLERHGIPLDEVQDAYEQLQLAVSPVSSYPPGSTVTWTRFPDR